MKWLISTLCFMMLGVNGCATTSLESADLVSIFQTSLPVQLGSHRINLSVTPSLLHVSTCPGTPIMRVGIQGFPRVVVFMTKTDAFAVLVLQEFKREEHYIPIGNSGRWVNVPVEYIRAMIAKMPNRDKVEECVKNIETEIRETKKPQPTEKKGERA